MRDRPNGSKHAPRNLKAGALVSALILGLALVSLHARAYVPLSPIDELQHIDYLEQASRFDLVRNGERVGSVAMREQACRTVDSPGFVSPPCDAAELRPEQFQELGYNTAATHPPTYYTLTGLAARAVLATPQVDSFVAAGRLVGGLWLGLGLFVTFLLCRRLGARWTSTTGALLLLATTPVVLHSSAVVTNDAPSLFVGGLLVLLALLVRERAASPLWLAAAAALATAVKATNILAVGVAALVLLIPIASAWRTPATLPDDRRATTQRNLVGAGLVIFGGLASPLVWMNVSRATVIPDAGSSPMSRFMVPTFDWTYPVVNFFATFTPLQNPYVPGILQTTAILFIVSLLNLLVALALAGAAWYRTQSAAVNDVAVSTMVGLALGGPLLVVLFFVMADSYIAIPARYGLSLLPAAFGVLAHGTSLHRWGGTALLSLGVLSLVSVLGALLPG